MKKNILVTASIALALAAISITGCKKDDTTPPVITLLGQSTINVTLNGTYTDEGATAKDDEDGDITSSITVTNLVDEDLTGSYTVTYTVTDAAGNTATATRTVVVANSSQNIAGTYNGVDTSPYPGTAGNSFPVTITASSTVNNRLIISKFANYINAGINIDVTGTTVTVAPQTVTCGTPALSHTFTTSKINTSSGINGAVITIYYTDDYTNNGAQHFEGQTIYTKQ